MPELQSNTLDKLLSFRILFIFLFVVVVIIICYFFAPKSVQTLSSKRNIYKPKIRTKKTKPTVNQFVKTLFYFPEKFITH